MARGIIGWILDRVAPGLFRLMTGNIESVFNALSPSVKGLTRSYLGGWFRTWDKQQTYAGVEYKTGYDKFPSWAMIESDEPHGRRYLNTYKITGVNKFTGEIEEIWQNHYHMKWESQAGWELTAKQWYMRHEDLYKLENITVQLWTAKHKIGWTY